MLTPDERAAMLAKRRKLKHRVRNSTLYAKNRESAAIKRKARARLLSGCGVDLTHDEAAALCACLPSALGVWLYRYTGSTLWPPSEAQLKKLHDMCN